MAIQITYCDACKFDDSLVEAKGFCVLCTDYLCQMCCRDHKRIKATRSHTLLENDEMPTDKGPFQRLHKLTRCELHQDHELAYECMDHKTVICVVCLSETHRKCEDILDFALVSGETETISFTEQRCRLENITSKKENCLRKLILGQQGINTDVNDFRKLLKEHIDRLADKLLIDVNDGIKAEKQKHEKAKNKYKRLKSHIDDGIELIQLADAHCTKRQSAVVLRYFKNLKIQIENDMDTLIQQPLQCLALTKDTSILNCECIGKIELLPKSLDDFESGSDNLTFTMASVAQNKENETLRSVLPARESSEPALNKSTTIQRQQNKNKEKNKFPGAKFVNYPAKPVTQEACPSGISKPNQASHIHEAKQSNTAHLVKTRSDDNTCSVDALALLANGNIAMADSSNAKTKLLRSVLPATESSEPALTKSKEVHKRREKKHKNNKLSDEKYVNEPAKPVTQEACPSGISKPNQTSHIHEAKQSKTANLVKTRSDDNTCSVDALVLLANGNIAMADSSNAKIKLFTRTFDLLDEVCISGHPIDLCVIGQYIYFCCSNIRKIFRHACDGSKLSHGAVSFDTKEQPISISKSGSKLVILFSDAAYDDTKAGDVQLEIRAGNTRERISWKNSSFAMNHVPEAKRIHYRSSYSNDVILAEFNRISVYTISRTSKELCRRVWYYTSGKLQKARGIAMDSNHNVYVCGEGSNNVHRVSSLHYSINRVIVPQIRKPISVCVDEQNKRLLVGCKNDDFVHSFPVT